VSYGAFVHVGLRVAEKLAADGIEASVLDLRSLVPLDRDAVLALARRCHRVLIIHEDSRTGGIGESLAATVSEAAFEFLDASGPHRRRARYAGAVLAAARGVLSAERGADRARRAPPRRVLMPALN
jgi:pyruvate/2-oxoglutarate/acetoin dehydrogenase E1 component